MTPSANTRSNARLRRLQEESATLLEEVLSYSATRTSVSNVQESTRSDLAETKTTPPPSSVAVSSAPLFSVPPATLPRTTFPRSAPAVPTSHAVDSGSHTTTATARTPNEQQRTLGLRQRQPQPSPPHVQQQPGPILRPQLVHVPLDPDPPSSSSSSSSSSPPSIFSRGASSTSSNTTADSDDDLLFLLLPPPDPNPTMPRLSDFLRRVLGPTAGSLAYDAVDFAIPGWPPSVGGLIRLFLACALCLLFLLDAVLVTHRLWRIRHKLLPTPSPGRPTVNGTDMIASALALVEETSEVLAMPYEAVATVEFSGGAAALATADLSSLAHQGGTMAATTHDGTVDVEAYVRLFGQISERLLLDVSWLAREVPDSPFTTIKGTSTMNGTSTESHNGQKYRPAIFEEMRPTVDALNRIVSETSQAWFRLTYSDLDLVFDTMQRIVEQLQRAFETTSGGQKSKWRGFGPQKSRSDLVCHVLVSHFAPLNGRGIAIRDALGRRIAQRREAAGDLVALLDSFLGFVGKRGSVARLTGEVLDQLPLERPDTWRYALRESLLHSARGTASSQQQQQLAHEYQQIVMNDSHVLLVGHLREHFVDIESSADKLLRELDGFSDLVSDICRKDEAQLEFTSDTDGDGNSDSNSDGNQDVLLAAYSRLNLARNRTRRQAATLRRRAEAARRKYFDRWREDFDNLHRRDLDSGYRRVWSSENSVVWRVLRWAGLVGAAAAQERQTRRYEAWLDDGVACRTLAYWVDKRFVRYEDVMASVNGRGGGYDEYFERLTEEPCLSLRVFLRETEGDREERARRVDEERMWDAWARDWWFAGMSTMEFGTPRVRVTEMLTMDELKAKPGIEGVADQIQVS